MTSGLAIADLQRLSEEVARDPGSSSYLPLADAYRRLGKTQAALRVCLRGLECSPGHVDGHLLLARLYLELGDRERAADEWAVAVRPDPENFHAHRDLAFFPQERGELSSASRPLARPTSGRWPCGSTRRTSTHVGVWGSSIWSGVSCRPRAGTWSAPRWRDRRTRRCRKR